MQIVKESLNILGHVEVRRNIDALEDDWVDRGTWEIANTKKCLSVNSLDPNVICIEVFERLALLGFAGRFGVAMAEEGECRPPSMTPFDALRAVLSPILSSSHCRLPFWFPKQANKHVQNVLLVMTRSITSYCFRRPTNFLRHPERMRD